ncbi:hypothetical protein IFM89_006018 [Coptis chinensis]|uniref:Uncharacterized protein n=1 Tax=Coptis chinensis TaxID=261450 RepID=A0A835I0B5_9MAGN|nr:hypothetical protein IFM89_006018 [Coptis chinensis]
MKKKFNVGGSPKKLILHLGGYLERGPDIDLTPTTQVLCSPVAGRPGKVGRFGTITKGIPRILLEDGPHTIPKEWSEGEVPHLSDRDAKGLDTYEYMTESDKIVDAQAHIGSGCMKTLKRDYIAVKELLESTEFGFSYNQQTKCIDADRQARDAYFKAHPAARHLKRRMFTYFAEACVIFGNDYSLHTPNVCESFGPVVGDTP